MVSRHLTLGCVLAVGLFAADRAHAFNLLAPGDPIVAIDLDFSLGSESPIGEQAVNVLDGDPQTKYLNFGVTDTGFIVTPSAPAAVQSFQLTTANDAVERDPASWRLFGTNDTIISTEHSDGRAENWVEISMDDLMLPDDRTTVGGVVGFSNATSYSSYKMTYPTVKDAGTANSMQVAEVSFYPSMDGTGGNLLSGTDFIIPIRDADLMPSSNSPEAEGPGNAIDRTTAQKYLNFGEERSGLIVTPSFGAAAVTGIQITTANDAPERDPTSYELYGTNDAIVTPNNGIGNAESWTLIDSGSIELPFDRDTVSPVVPVTGGGAFSSYRVIFPTVRDAATANSMQIAELALLAADEATVEVNRQTGEVIVRAIDATSFESYEIRSRDSGGIDSLGWTSIAATDADPNDTWQETSSDNELLAENDAPGGADDGFTLPPGGTYSLGAIWETLPTAFEDLDVDLRRTDGTRVGAGVAYVGTEIPFGDYSGNGTVGPEDWPTFRNGYGGDYAGLSAVDAYLSGDLDGDFDSDLDDFNLFVAAAGGAAALFGVPEPASAALLILVAGVGVVATRRRLALIAVLAAVMTVSSATAQVFTNVGGAPVATSIPAGQENETPFTGPQNFFDDDFLDDPSVINDELFLLDYNDPDLQGGPFFQYQGLGEDPKTVFFDYGSPVTANWFAYAQRSGSDPTADRVGQFEFWFSNTDFGNVVPTSTPDAIVSLAPDDSRLQDSALRPYSLGSDQSGRYVAMRLTVSELSANQGTNNIGGHEFRLLSGPGDVVLEVNRANGALTLRNNEAGAQGINMKSYAIRSPAGGLDVTGFNGLGGDNGSFPLGNGSGNGWEIGSGSNAGRLVEGYFASTSILGAGVSGLSLGNGYNELTLAEDVMFQWSNADGDVFDARVEYVGVAPQILPGDYNDDGVVNAADYVVWRDADGISTTLPNDVTPGTIDRSDYDRWAANYGTTAPAANAVPEPTSLLVVLLGALLSASRGRSDR